MSIDRDILKKAKQALNEMPKKKKDRISRRELVSELIKEIQSLRKTGYTYDDICTEVNKTLPKEAQMATTTFASYARKARAEADLEPLTKWTRRTQGRSENQPESGSGRKPHTVTEVTRKAAPEAHAKASAKPSTAADFRDGDAL